MVDIRLIPIEEFDRVRKAPIDRYARLSLIADMCRANTLAMVKRAGSGHIGTSFSSMDLVVWLYHEEINTVRLGIDNIHRDIYFSSKGHDVPGLYAVLFSLGVIPKERFLKLRRLGGLEGHPDVGVPGIEANSGSLGMGISKGRGMAWAKRLLGLGGRVYVMTGDGELQEGQIYESLQSTVQQGITNLTVIVDHNKVQSDKPVREIIDLRDLQEKFRSFGWHTAQCDGHDFRQIERALAELTSANDRPGVLIADTIKGRGVSFMEHPFALREAKGLYRWHAGAPDDASFSAGFDEIMARISHGLSTLGLPPLATEAVGPFQAAVAQNALGEPVSNASKKSKPSLKATAEYVVEAYGKALVEIAARRPDLVVLDADLAADCRIRQFEAAYPDRFIENGIAEQDMVSMAGGLARLGLLPVVNSFANFLVSRASEQIYNNASEGTKIIYAAHYGGMIPAGPGKSHQSIRDISLLGALPNMIVIQPADSEETRQALRYAVDEARENVTLRLAIGPSPRTIPTPGGHRLTFGRGVALTGGDDALLIAYGPVMLSEALTASEILSERGFGLTVINMPWLNRVDSEWLVETVTPHKRIYVLEDHAPVGGLGDFLLGALAQEGALDGRRLIKAAVKGYPVFGTPQEALSHHGLDGASLAAQILRDHGK